MQSSSSRSKRLTGKTKSPLFQFWTTLRFRMFLRAAADVAGTDMSTFVREAVWSRCVQTLDEKTQTRIERAVKQEEEKRCR